MKTIQGYSDEEWQEIKDIISPALELGPGPQALQPAINLLNRATEENSHQWVYWYALGDYAQRVNDLELALTAAQEAHHLRPRDPRSLYALATIYWALAAVTPESERSYAVKAIDRFNQLLRLHIAERDKRLVTLHIRSVLSQHPKARDHILERESASTPPRKKKRLSLFWIIVIVLVIGTCANAGRDPNGLVILIPIAFAVLVRYLIRNAPS